MTERSGEDGPSAWSSGGSAGPGHGLSPPAWSINGVQDGGFEVSHTTHTHNGQVHQPATRPKAAAQPSASVPASLSAALTDGPEPHIVTPERFAGGSETCGARAIRRRSPRSLTGCLMMAPPDPQEPGS